MKHLIIFLLTLISFTASAQITNNTAWYKFAQKLTVGGKLQIPNDTLTLTAQDTGLVAIVGDKFYIAAVIGGTLQWGEVISGGGGGGGIAAGDTTAMLANYFNQAIRSGDSIIFYNSGVRLAGVYSPITGGAVWGGITGDPSDQADLQALLNAKANTSHTHAAADITSGIIAAARLGSGTADATTVLYGNGTWAAPSSFTIGAISASGTANGASLTAGTFTLHPATSSLGGVLTSGAQTIGGRKTFSDAIIAQGSGGISGVVGTATSGNGGFFSSSSGIAVAAVTDRATTNTTEEVFRTSRTTTGTAANDIGALWGFVVETSSGATTNYSNTIRSIWSNVDNATRNSTLKLTGVGNTLERDVVSYTPGTLTTTNNTPSTILTLPITDETVGIMEVTLHAKSSATQGGVTGKKIIRYRKDGGTLTLGAITDILTTVADGDLTTATWTITASANDIIIQVTGETGKTISWTCVTNILRD